MRKCHMYFSFWVENTKIENALEIKIMENNKENKYDFFDTWYKVMDKKRKQNKLLQNVSRDRNEIFEKSVLTALLKKIERKYELLDRMKACERYYVRYQCRIILYNFRFLRRNRRANAFFMKKKFASFMRRVKLARRRGRRGEKAMLRGNRVIVRKLLMRWKKRYLGGDNSNENNGNGSNNDNNGNNSSKIHENDSNSSNNGIDNNRNVGSIADSDTNSKIRNNCHSNNSIRLKKSWQTPEAKQHTQMLVLARRPTHLLFLSLRTLSQHRKYSVKSKTLLLNCHRHRCVAMQHKVFRALLGVIRMKHRRNRDKPAHERHLLSFTLYRGFALLERRLTAQWVDAQRLRMAAVRARRGTLWRGLRHFLLHRKKEETRTFR